MRVPQPLLLEIAEGRCLPFIGAGFSLNAELPNDLHMPSWSQLADTLAVDLGAPSGTDPVVIASHYERKFGRVLLIEAIRSALHPDHARPGTAHTSLVQLPFETIFTTNFDMILEDSLTQLGKPFRSLVGELQMPFHGGHRTTNVVKMHGDINHAEHIIATGKDYDSYLEEYPVIATFLSAMLITKTAMFIGYSRTDKDFLHIEEVVKSRLGKFQRMPYLVQFDVGREEVEDLYDQHQHVISLSVPKGKTRGDVLTEFFSSIQRQVDMMAGKGLRDVSATAFEPISEDTLEKTIESPDASLLLSSSSSLCYVIIPTGKQSDRIFHRLIRPAVESSRLEALRAENMDTTGPVMEQVRAAIQQSRICIVDISHDSPTVAYEFSLARGLDKPILVIARRGEPVLPQYSEWQVLHYDPLEPEKALPTLQSAIEGIQGQNILQSAERAISLGMYRAGVATLGTVLEHSLHTLLESSNLGDTKARAKWLAPSQMVRHLSAAKRITAEEHRELLQFLEMRNRAVHRLDETTGEEAAWALDRIGAFIKDTLKSNGA